MTHHKYTCEIKDLTMGTRTINAELTQYERPKIPYSQSNSVGVVSAAGHAWRYATSLAEVINSSRVRRAPGFRGAVAYALDRARSVVGKDTRSQIIKALGAPSVSAVVKLSDGENPFCSARLETANGDQRLSSGYLSLKPARPTRPEVRQGWETTRDGFPVGGASNKSYIDTQQAYLISEFQRDLAQAADAGSLVMRVSVEAQD